MSLTTWSRYTDLCHQPHAWSGVAFLRCCICFPAFRSTSELHARGWGSKVHVRLDAYGSTDAHACSTRPETCIVRGRPAGVQIESDPLGKRSLCRLNENEKRKGAPPPASVVGRPPPTTAGQGRRWVVAGGCGGRAPPSRPMSSAESWYTRQRLSSLPSGPRVDVFLFLVLGIEVLCRVARVFALGKGGTTRRWWIFQLLLKLKIAESYVEDCRSYLKFG